MRLFAILLCLCVALTLFGCTNNVQNKTSAAFYYCVNEIDHLNSRKVFGMEERNVISPSENLLEFLNVYLEGPNSDDLYNPFPIGAAITNVKREGNVLTLNLSQHFDRLPIEKLSLAIACLVQTTFKNTSVPVVLLIPSGTFVDGTTYKTFTADSFLYSDDNTAYSTP